MDKIEALFRACYRAFVFTMVYMAYFVFSGVKTEELPGLAIVVAMVGVVIGMGSECKTLFKS
jgi:hypothetical protein